MKKLLPFITLWVCLMSNLPANAQIITTIVGHYVYGSGSYSGDGGPATNARLNGPDGVAVDINGNIFFADCNNDVIREINASTGIITTIAGNHTQGFGGDGGPATNAELNHPQGIAVDASGNIYIADEGNNVIRKVSHDTISTIAGDRVQGFSGDGVQATAAELDQPNSVALDKSGNIYICDNANMRIREVHLTTGIINTIAGGGNCGSNYCGDGGAATAAELYYPAAVFVDSHGNIYIGDGDNSVIRKVSGGIINTVVGNHYGAGFSGDGGLATSAQLNGPWGVAVDSSGDIYISDYFNNVVREVNASNDIINTVAGNYPNYGYSGDGGAATAAELYYPIGVAVDTSGSIYISDAGNNVIRKVTNCSRSAINITPSSPSICNGKSVTLRVPVSGTNYKWSPSTDLSATTGDTVTATPSTTTTYTITGINSGGCSTIGTVIVTVNPNPTITATPNPTSYCVGGSSTLTASGGSAYTWSPSTDLNSTTGATVTANPTVTSTYTVTGTTVAGCSATKTVSVTVNPNPTITATPSPSSYCTGGSSTLTATGGSTYTWSPSTNLSATTGAIVKANPTLTSTYTVTGSNSNGCSATKTVIVTVNPNPTITASPSPSSYCPGGSSILTASGGSTYTWSPSTNLSATTGAVVTANPTATTTYTVTGTNSSGCSGIKTVSVTVNPNPTITATPSPASYCIGGSSTLTASGGNTYIWSPSSNLSATTGAIVTANPTVTSTYTVTGTTGAGCSATGTLTVTVNPNPTITATPNPAMYCSGGSSTLTASGGSTYIWSPSTNLSATTGATVTANPTVTSTYTVTGTNLSGCSESYTVTVTVNPTPVVTVLPSGPTICSGGSTTLIASGASTYSWSPAISIYPTTGASVLANPVITTTYSVIGTTNSCNDTFKVIINVDSLPDKPTITREGDTLISSSSNYYQWFFQGEPITGANYQSYIYAVDTGWYYVIVTNSNGCSNTSDSINLASTGFAQVELKNEITLFPNPFSNLIHFHLNEPIENLKDWNLKIIDELGRVVYSNNSLNYNNTFDLTNMPSGLYLIFIKNKSDYAVFKMTKQE